MPWSSVGHDEIRFLQTGAAGHGLQASPAILPLGRFRIVQGAGPAEMEKAVAQAIGAHTQTLVSARERFAGTMNRFETKGVSISFLSYGAGVAVDRPPLPRISQVFGWNGEAQAIVDRTKVPVNRQNSAVIPAGSPVSLRIEPEAALLLLQIDPAALRRKLVSIIGADIGQSLDFDASVDIGKDAGRSLFRLLRFVMSELNCDDANLPPTFIEELMQTLMMAFLCAASPSINRLIGRQTAAATPWQVRRAEEYIEANWDQPITVEALAIVTQVSARSIYNAFKKSRGYSPMAFTKAVRLRHAREMLSQPNARATVTDVAFSCSFGNLGHFANDYLAHFGERPSETLRKAKSGPASQGN